MCFVSSVCNLQAAKIDICTKNEEVRASSEVGDFVELNDRQPSLVMSYGQAMGYVAYLESPSNSEARKLIPHGNQDGYGEVVTVKDVCRRAHTVEVNKAKDMRT